MSLANYGQTWRYSDDPRWFADPLRAPATDEEPWPLATDAPAPGRRYVFLVAAALVAVLLLRKVRAA